MPFLLHYRKRRKKISLFPIFAPANTLRCLDTREDTLWRIYSGLAVNHSVSNGIILICAEIHYQLYLGLIGNHSVSNGIILVYDSSPALPRSIFDVQWVDNF